jgi:hypothetical protein
VFSHPLGVLSQSLVNVLDAMRPAQGSGLPGLLSARFERLAAIAGRAGLIARGSLLQQLAFLRAIAPVWVDANLMPGLLLNDDDAVDLMSVVARSVAPQYPDLFNRLKPAIIHALEYERTDDSVREMLSGALIGAAFSVIKGQGGFALTGVECRQTLTRVSNTVLARMAWELSSMLRDNDGVDARGAFWAEAIAPFLRDYWPNDVSARTPEVSENLAHLPALAGTAFEQAVTLVLDLVCPIQRYEIRFGLGLDEEDNDFITHFPRTTLVFLAGILDRAASPPSDLAQVIENLLQADPEIGSEPAFWRIRQMLRAD